jgi:hypothetical protein
MLTKLLNRIFLLITSREIMILLGLIIIVTSIPMVIEQVHFIRNYWNLKFDDHAINELEELIDGLGGILVAGGVFFEERETLRKMALGSEETAALQHRLNTVSHHNGMGILLMGLFMEIGSQVIEIPERIVNTDGVELKIFIACCIFSILALLIMFDFVKDYLKTYFIKADVH